MLVNPNVEYLAREMILRRWPVIEDQWRVKTRRADQRSAIDVENCPALWIVRELLDLLGEKPHHPARDLGPQIHQMLQEQEFVDENGDSCVLPEHEGYLQEQVNLIVGVLEDVRRIARSRGEWQDELSPPQMFG